MNCKDCLYYHPIIVGVTAKPQNGECRCHPPKSMMKNGKIEHIYPVVGRLTKACSEFDNKDKVVRK